jgi:hypothetical protein
MDSSHIKAEASKFEWRWGKECSFLLQVARMILDVRGLMNSNKKQHKMVLRMCTLILFQFPMGITYLLEMNM